MEGIDPIITTQTDTKSPKLMYYQRQAMAMAALDGGRLLRSIREAMGWSQEALARAAGCTQAILSHIETGRNGISPQKAERVASALGLIPPECGCSENG